MSYLPILSACVIGGLLQIASAASVPEIVSRRIIESPTIDGRLDEAAWHGAEVIDQFFRYNSEDPAPIPSLVYLMHDDKALYVGMVMMKAVGQPVKGQLWQDCVEIFIDPGRTREDCFQMAFAIDKDFGIAYRNGIADAGWKSGTQWAAREFPLGWMLEVAIPFDPLGTGVPADGDHWGLLICRNDVHYGRMTLAPIGGAYLQPPRFCSLTWTSTPPLPRGTDPTPAPTLAERIAESRQAAETLSAENPARSPLLERLAELSDLSKAIEHEADTQALIAPTIRRWAHDSIAAVLDESIDWQIRMSQLLFVQ